MFTITVQQTIGTETVEVFRSSRATIDVIAIAEAALKPARKTRSDRGKRKTAQDPQTFFPATGGEKA